MSLSLNFGYVFAFYEEIKEQYSQRLRGKRGSQVMQGAEEAPRCHDYAV